MSDEPALVMSYSFSESLITLALWGVAVFAIGYSFFVLAQRRFADEV